MLRIGHRINTFTHVSSYCAVARRSAKWANPLNEQPQGENTEVSAVNDICNAIHQEGGTVSMSRILRSSSSAARKAIIKSQLGVEGWLKKHPKVFRIEGTGSSKTVTMVNPSDRPKTAITYPEGFVCPPLPIRTPNGMYQPVNGLPVELYGSPDLDKSWFRNVEGLKCTDPAEDKIYQKMKAVLRHRHFYKVASLQAMMVKANIGQFTTAFLEKYYTEEKRFYWCQLVGTELWICLRQIGDTRAPPFSPTELPTASGPSLPAFSKPVADHLRFVELVLATCPLEFVDVQFIAPHALRRATIGSKHFITWLSLAPLFFDLRLVGHEAEVRRCPLLHYDQLRMTKEEAEAHVRKILYDIQMTGSNPIIGRLNRAIESISSHRKYHRIHND